MYPGGGGCDCVMANEYSMGKHLDLRLRSAHREKPCLHLTVFGLGRRSTPANPSAKLFFCLGPQQHRYILWNILDGLSKPCVYIILNCTSTIL
jgi:hypothetical protein